MNAEEGLNRIARAIRWIGIGFGGFCFLIGIFLLLGQGSGNGFIFTVILGAVCIGAGRVLGWIVEGFAKRDDS